MQKKLWLVRTARNFYKFGLVFLLIGIFLKSLINVAGTFISSGLLLNSIAFFKERIVPKKFDFLKFIIIPLVFFITAVIINNSVFSVLAGFLVVFHIVNKKINSRFLPYIWGLYFIMGYGLLFYEKIFNKSEFIVSTAVTFFIFYIEYYQRTKNSASLS